MVAILYMEQGLGQIKKDCALVPKKKTVLAN